MILDELSEWYKVGELVLDLNSDISSDENLLRTPRSRNKRCAYLFVEYFGA